jgi:hypothetical protein
MFLTETSLDELKKYVAELIPAKYVYISHTYAGPKSIAVYNLYYNSHLPGSRLSQTTIENQTVGRTVFTSGSMYKPKFSRPILLSEYSRPLRESSIINIIDLAGIHLSQY